jgi:hypothetical protein
MGTAHNGNVGTTTWGNDAPRLLFRVRRRPTTKRGIARLLKRVRERYGTAVNVVLWAPLGAGGIYEIRRPPVVA